MLIKLVMLLAVAIGFGGITFIWNNQEFVIANKELVAFVLLSAISLCLFFTFRTLHKIGHPSD